MTRDQENALRSLLADLCASEECTSFAQRWGRVEPSTRRPRGVRIECGPASPFGSLEVRPWNDEVTGVVDVELRAGERLVWDDLCVCFGPFEKLPALDVAENKFGAVWTTPGAAASAFLIVSVIDGVVDSLTIRRDAR